MDDQKEKALKFALSQIERSHGKGAIMSLGAKPDLNIETVSTGALSLDLAVEYDVITKAGTWFSYGEHRMGQGREAAKGYLKKHPEQYKEIRNTVKEKVLVKGESETKPKKAEVKK